jgi:hypothetical protein
MGFGTLGIPQGMFEYEGLGQFVKSASFTLTPGLTPSVCNLKLNALPFTPASNGTLRISYGGVAILFYGCKLDSANATSSGAQEYSVVILDRRWRWSDLGSVNGNFNVHINHILQAETEKTPKELVAMCLDELGEVGYDISLVPDLLRPEVDWDYTRPVNALSALLDEIGCMLVLGVDNRVYVIPQMYTTVNLDSNDVTSWELSVDPPDPPGNLVIVTQKIKHQHDFLLEAVCYDINHRIVKIEDLSFAPSPFTTDGGWYWPGWTASDKDGGDLVEAIVGNRRAKILAKKYLWRMYRIVPTSTVNWEPPFEVLLDQPITGVGEVVTKVRDIELLNGMSETIVGDDGVVRPKPAVVWGIHTSSSAYFTKDNRLVNGENFDPIKVVDDPPAPLTDEEKKDNNGLYEGGFSIDSDTGCVMFNDPMCEELEQGYANEKKTRYVACTQLYLRTACYVRKPSNGRWNRREYSAIPDQAVNPAAWATRYEMREDLEPYVHRAKLYGTVLTDNFNEIEQESLEYWNAVALEYQPKDAASVTYIGFRLVGCDGAVRQVTWTLGEDGKAFTRVSRNREEHHLSISFRERRRIEDRKAVAETAKIAARESKRIGRYSGTRRARS